MDIFKSAGLAGFLGFTSTFSVGSKTLSDAQKQAVSDEEDKFETSMFLTLQKQVEENKFEKFLTRQKQENKFKTMFLTSEAV